MNLRELLCGYPVRLRYTLRFSTCRVAYRESVAEHSYFVALYSMLIGKHMADRGTMLYMGTMLCKALVHDLEEAVTGDVPRTFKYSSPETKAALDLGAAEAIKDIADRIFPFGSQVNAFADLWAKSKDTSIEGRIVAFADFLSVLSYLLQERIDHNQLILEHCSAMETHFKIYSDPSFDFIRDLVNEAGTLMQELFSKEVT